MTLPILDMTAWSILDFELAIDGLSQMREAALWLLNQPRASTEDRNHPGAAYVAALGELSSKRVDDIMTRLEHTRFPDPAQEDRRIRLLVTYYGGFGPGGYDIPALMDLIAAQRQPLAA